MRKGFIWIGIGLCAIIAAFISVYIIFPQIQKYQQGRSEKDGGERGTSLDQQFRRSAD